jgi:hypothetical protein
MLLVVLAQLVSVLLIFLNPALVARLWAAPRGQYPTSMSSIMDWYSACRGAV